jgi:hypothetical protein
MRGDYCDACWTGVGPDPRVGPVVPSQCIDTNNQCNVFAMLGQCQASATQQYMQQNCCASCNSQAGQPRPQPIATSAPTIRTSNTVTTPAWINPREAGSREVTSPPAFCSGPGCISLEEGCNTNPCEQYSFKCDDWSACDVTCGVGSQKRDCPCVNTDGQKVEDSLCDTNLLGDKPQTVKTCKTFTDCSPYGFAYTPWCTRAVDPCLDKVVTFSRDATCTDQDGKTVRNELCSQDSPSTELKCNNIDTYEVILTDLGCDSGVTRAPVTTNEPTAVPTKYTSIGSLTIGGNYDELSTDEMKALIIDLARKLGAGGCGSPYADGTRPGYWVIECAGGKMIRAKISAGSIVIEYEATGFEPDEIAKFEEAMKDAAAAPSENGVKPPAQSIGAGEVLSFLGGTGVPTVSPTEEPTTAVPTTPTPTADPTTATPTEEPTTPVPTTPTPTVDPTTATPSAPPTPVPSNPATPAPVSVPATPAPAPAPAPNPPASSTAIAVPNFFVLVALLVMAALC